MLKKGPLWAIYTSSYFIDYILILGILIWKKKQSFPDWNKFIQKCTLGDWIIWITLLVLIVVSIITMIGIKKLKMTSRIKYFPKDDIVWEAYSGFLAPALALVATFFGDYGLIFSLVIFVVTGIAFVLSKQAHLASVFIFPMGYKIFKAEEKVLITRDSKDGLRLKIEENTDGVEAKELEPGIFLLK